MFGFTNLMASIYVLLHRFDCFLESDQAKQKTVYHITCINSAQFMRYLKLKWILSLCHTVSFYVFYFILHDSIQCIAFTHTSLRKEKHRTFHLLLKICRKLKLKSYAPIENTHLYSIQHHFFGGPSLLVDLSVTVKKQQQQRKKIYNNNLSSSCLLYFFSIIFLVLV